MPAAFLKRVATGLLPVLALSMLLLTSLYLMSGATDNSATFNRMYGGLLIVNVLGVVVLLGLIAFNLRKLVRQYRNHVPGARLTTRILLMLVVIAVVPVSVVYYFSLEFLHRGIDSWFDVKVERGLSDSLELSRAALEGRMRELLKQTQQMGGRLEGVSDELAPLTLEDMRLDSDASELTLIGSGRVIASSGTDMALINPNRPDEAILSYIRQSGNYVGLDPIRGSGLHVRAVVKTPGADPVSAERVLQALYPVSERHSELAANVQAIYSKYDELVYLRKPLKFSFMLTLSLVLLLALLTAIWAAFFSARRLVEPVRELAEGTRAVAAGDYGKRLTVSGGDELGFLVQSFNDMTRKIETARNEVERSQRLAESQHAYLDAVLKRLSSGVLTLDADGTLRTVNAAASQILRIDLESHLGDSLDEIAAAHPSFKRFVEILEPRRAEGREWREEVILFGSGGRKVLMCGGAPLRSEFQNGRSEFQTDRGELQASGDMQNADGVQAGGDVVVFDDITALIQAQRDAAWGEVARRLAHEIKNPLTPIQLSAERLRHKYLKTMDADQAEVLDRATHTIVAQVETMKEMVNAFSEYARPPQIELRARDLNRIIGEVLDLYRQDEATLSLEVELDPSMPQVEADNGRLRQLVHNLIKNAMEALEGVAHPRIGVRTRCMQEASCRFVEIQVQDNGPGIPEDVLDHLFEPYVTTKPKGSGLGLAIVKKIVEEHGGMIWAENEPSGGARMVIRLPVRETAERFQRNKSTSDMPSQG